MSFTFATLFKPTLSKALNIAKILDDKVEKFVEKLSSELNLEITSVRNAVAVAITVFENDEEKLKQTELEIKKAEREKLKAEREEKKRIENEKKEIKKLEREQLKAERDDKKRIENEKKEIKKLEKENNKAEKQPKVKVEKQTIVCDGDECESKPKSPKEINGKNYCSKCAKKVEKQLKQETKVQCVHIGKKDKQCSSNATKGEYCSRHAKNETKSENTEVTTINNFNFATEKTESYDDDDNKYWDDVKKATIKKYGKVLVHNICNVVFKEDKEIIGVFDKKSSAIIAENDLSETIKKWIAKCDLVVPSLPEDEETEISFDENNEDEFDDVILVD